MTMVTDILSVTNDQGYDRLSETVYVTYDQGYE